MKIVINADYGGFGLSDEAVKLYLTKKGIEFIEEDSTLGGMGKEFYIQGKYFSPDKIKRDDPILVEVVKELNVDSFGVFATLAIVEIPDDVEWQIEEYDGCEWIAEKHRTCGNE